MTVSRSKAIAVNQAPVTVFNSIVSRQTVGTATIQYWDPATWKITGACSLSMSSWGEDVSIQVCSGRDGGTVLVVESHTSLPTALVDFGKNQKNVDAICDDVARMFPGGVFEVEG